MKKTYLLLWMIASFLFANAQFDFSGKALIPNNPDVRKGKLPNGLTYYILKNSKPAKRAELRLAVNVGSTMEDDNQQGLAHFTEHMCFNGTRHFPGNDIIKYFESKGIKFGKDLNAYTSFDETVYRITVPTDSQQIFEKGLLVLEDWASNVLETDEEIDKERGVIVEEWRLGQGAEERMRNKYWPVLFINSRYAQRLPIGKKEIIETFDHPTLRNFYHDWYRPDLMAVVVVGDVDVDKVEKLIKEHFTPISVLDIRRPLQSFPVEEFPNMLISKVTDKEATNTTVSIYYKQPAEPVITVNDMKRDLIYDLYNSMMNNRLSEIQRQANPPFIYANAYYGQLVRTKNSFTCSAVVKEKGVMKGLESLATENERVRRYGFTSSELERTKKMLLRNMESSFAEKDKTESSSYARALVNNFLDNDPYPNTLYKLEFYKKFLPEIKVDEVNRLAGNWFTPDGRNMVVVITGSDKAEIPSDTAINEFFLNIMLKNISAYKDDLPDQPLLTEKLNPSTILKENYIKELNITEWTLANGVRIILKPTDFKNDQVLISAYAKGGTSLCNDKDYQSASMAASIISRSGLGSYDFSQLQKYLKGKIVNVNPILTELTEEFRGSSSPQDIETLFQMIYLYFTKPRKDSVAFLSFIDQTKGFLENISADPQSSFLDTIRVTMAQHNIRRMPLDLERLKQTNLNTSYEIFKDRFSDASGFTFIFVGNIKPDSIKPLVERYLGNLPATKKNETWKDLGIRPPAGMINKTVKKGIEQKSTVRVVFTGSTIWNWKNRADLNTLLLLANIRLRESIREEKGGTYGIRVSSNIDHYPAQLYTVNIEFGCDPTRVGELTNDVFDVLKKIISDGITTAELATIKEQLKREREVNMKENMFWSSYLSSAYQNGDDVLDVLKFNNYVDNLKAEDIKSLAAKYFSMNNYAKFVLLPEK